MRASVRCSQSLTGTGEDLRKTEVISELKMPSLGAVDSAESLLEHVREIQRTRGSQDKDISTYLYLRVEQKNNPTVFYDALIKYCQELLPYLYTPTVGEACQKYHRLPIPTYGVYVRADCHVRAEARGMTRRDVILEKLKHIRRDLYDADEIQVVVVTDGERILGLGDLGVGGMGISEGKSLLYTAAAGVSPRRVLPVCLDVGTNNEDLLNDEEYFGMKQQRLVGDAYHAFIEDFIQALKAWRTHVVLQFEDFANHMAFDLLQEYRHNMCCFNDDIQGTASITLSGLLAALRVTGQSLMDQRVLFLGAGEAGAGIGELIAKGLHVWHGVSMEEGRRHCFFIDSKGLITKSRYDSLQDHKKPFAHDLAPCSSLVEAVEIVKPTAIIGVSTQPGSFTMEVMKMMAQINERPIIFPLSNPTSKSECTFEAAYAATKGKVLFASGSPFPPLVGADGVTYSPAQSNNAYIFPALGHAASLCKAKEISDEAFLMAAKALSLMASADELKTGMLFPRFSCIRTVSSNLMAMVASDMCATGVGKKPEDFDDVTRHVSGGDEVEKWRVYASKCMYSTSPSSKECGGVQAGSRL